MPSLSTLAIVVASSSVMNISSSRWVLTGRGRAAAAVLLALGVVVAVAGDEQLVLDRVR